METERFFAELASRLETARRKDRTTYRRFFAELAPRLETARALEAELDRHLARRFNVFDYVKTDELGISQILHDLLDPQGTHGQGTLFLERFVDGLGKQMFRPNLSTGRISVDVEEVIPSNRRIDIYVQIGEGDGAQCLAIENKPYARGQERKVKNQVKDYLTFLKDKFGERFLLIYLSPNGEGPSNSSIPKKELGNWKGQFAILPYYMVDRTHQNEGEQNQPDGFEDYRLPYSLADWFKDCRCNCEVDRLRWFLRDAEIFCQRRFGDYTMTSDSETKAVRDYLLSNPKNLPIARTVYASWPAIRDEICRPFFDQLCLRVEEKAKEAMPDFADDLRVARQYWGARKWADCFWLYQKSWGQYENSHSGSKGHTAICMQVAKKSPNGWLYGVVCPNRQENYRDSLVAALHEELGDENKSAGWPWWKYVDERYRNWDYLVADLYRERDQEDSGDVMKYFVDLLVGTAERVIPIINKLERD